jgi:hypothetical protein
MAAGFRSAADKFYSFILDAVDSLILTAFKEITTISYQGWTFRKVWIATACFTGVGFIGKYKR